MALDNLFNRNSTWRCQLSVSSMINPRNLVLLTLLKLLLQVIKLSVGRSLFLDLNSINWVLFKIKWSKFLLNHALIWLKVTLKCKLKVVRLDSVRWVMVGGVWNKSTTLVKNNVIQDNTKQTNKQTNQHIKFKLEKRFLGAPISWVTSIWFTSISRLSGKIIHQQLVHFKR